MNHSISADVDTVATLVQFEVLGPICVVGGVRRVQLRAARQRIVLAALLLNPNRVVSGDSLIDALWEDDPPATARSQVHICVSAIRGILRELGAGDLISTEPATGYRIQVRPEQLDYQRFQQLIASASTLADQGQLAEAVEHQHRALALWRGPALSGVLSAAIAGRAIRLEEDRMLAQEACADWELELGRHRELTSLLAERVREHPLRERPRAQLMLALHRSARQAEALQIYRQGRTELIEQLGLEPGEELRRVEAMILADTGEPRSQQPVPEPAGVANPASGPVVTQALPVPRQLPAAIADFVGREAEIELLSTLLAEPKEPTVPVVAAVGGGGVGKSALAIQVAHRLAAERFPDGQLYARFDPGATYREPAEVLSGFLRALGVACSAIPVDIDERAELYRSLLANRRVLVLIEDVTTEAQVRPLLPGSPTCGVLITSRSKLSGPPGAETIAITAFDERQASQLLARLIGAERVSREQAEVSELTRLVDGLPLGLRIIGSRLSARPHWSLRRMASRLADPLHRLDELDYGEADIRSSIAVSYRGLDAQASLLLRLLCEFSAGSFPDWIAAALLDIDQFDALELLELLVDRQLVWAAAEPGQATRYSLPALVRIFAHEDASADPVEFRTDALARMAGGWLWLAEQTQRQSRTGLALHGSAPRWSAGLTPLAGHQWLTVERANLVAAARHATAAGLHELGWDLAITLADLLGHRTDSSDQIEQLQLDLVSALRQAGHCRGEAALLCSLGGRYAACNQIEQARAALAAALRAFTELRDPVGQVLTNRALDQLRVSLPAPRTRPGASPRPWLPEGSMAWLRRSWREAKGRLDLRADP